MWFSDCQLATKVVVCRMFWSMFENQWLAIKMSGNHLPRDTMIFVVNHQSSIARWKSYPAPKTRFLKSLATLEYLLLLHNLNI